MQEKESRGINNASPVETKLANILTLYQKIMYLSPRGISPALIDGELSPLWPLSNYTGSFNAFGNHPPRALPNLNRHPSPTDPPARISGATLHRKDKLTRCLSVYVHDKSNPEPFLKQRNRSEFYFPVTTNPHSPCNRVAWNNNGHSDRYRLFCGLWNTKVFLRYIQNYTIEAFCLKGFVDYPKAIVYIL